MQHHALSSANVHTALGLVSPHSIFILAVLHVAGHYFLMGLRQRQQHLALCIVYNCVVVLKWILCIRL